MLGAESMHRTAMVCEPVMVVDGPEGSECVAGLTECNGRRSIEPRQLARLGRPPCCDIERERGQVGDRDLRRLVSQAVSVVRQCPQTHTCPRLLPASATGPLIDQS